MSLIGSTSYCLDIVLPLKNDYIAFMSILVSENALKQIRKILDNEPEGTMLRVSVEGGGCSGFQYKYELTQEHQDDDLVLGDDKAKVLIDPVSQPFLDNAVIDYKQDLIGSAFQINNPNVSSSCGCGVSFSLA
jgi:iron-sulfur cluster assembly accessory protein